MEKQSIKKRLLAATAGTTVVALAAGGVAMASTPSPTKSPSKPSASASAPAGPSASTGRLGRHDLRQEIRWLATHTVHANLIVDTAHGYKTITIDRGSLTQGSSKSITITRPDGPKVSAVLTSSTRFPGLSESQLTKGDRVVLVQAGGNAVVVWARPPLAASSTSNG
jgi:hypothetical protein